MTSLSPVGGTAEENVDPTVSYTIVAQHDNNESDRYDDNNKGDSFDHGERSKELFEDLMAMLKEHSYEIIGDDVDHSNSSQQQETTTTTITATTVINELFHVVSPSQVVNNGTQQENIPTAQELQNFLRPTMEEYLTTKSEEIDTRRQLVWKTNLPPIVSKYHEINNPDSETQSPTESNCDDETQRNNDSGTETAEVVRGRLYRQILDELLKLQHLAQQKQRLNQLEREFSTINILPVESIDNEKHKMMKEGVDDNDDNSTTERTGKATLLQQYRNAIKEDLRLIDDNDSYSSMPVTRHITISFDEDQFDTALVTSLHDPDTAIPPESCSSCHWKITTRQRRWRCLPCRSVLCDDCYSIFHRVFHDDCYEKQSIDKTLLVCEECHPQYVCHQAANKHSLRSAVMTTFRGFHDRRLLGTYDSTTKDVTWLTYQQVLDQAIYRASVLTNQTETVRGLALCFPPGGRFSVEFYLWDIACVLTKIPTIGIPYPPPPIDDWPNAMETDTNPDSFTITHVVGSNDTFRQFSKNFPRNLHHLVSEDYLNGGSVGSDFIPFDIDSIGLEADKDHPSDIYTVWLTSGTTGRPKQIPCTCREHKKDFFNHEPVGTPNVKCVHGKVDYLPPNWSTGRNVFYHALQAGFYVGFSQPSPSIQHIVEAAEVFRPTIMTFMPVVVQSLCTVDDDTKSDLGGRLRYTSVGSAPIAKSTLKLFQEKYNIRSVKEGYGTTEIGGIASNGWLLDDVIHKVRLRNVDANDDRLLDGEQKDDVWLDTSKEGAVGELWIGDKNTGDIVELTEHGMKVRVIGRSRDASSTKLSNGQWCSFIEIESRILQACSPMLFDDAMVWCNRHGMLVLLVSNPHWEGSLPSLLQEVLSRLDSTELAPEKRPRSILCTSKPLARNSNMKLQRHKVISEFEQQADASTQSSQHVTDKSDGSTTASDVVAMASQILGLSRIDPAKSFIENGGTSMTSVQWIHELQQRFPNIMGSNLQSRLTDLPLESIQTVVLESTTKDSLSTMGDNLRQARLSLASRLESKIQGSIVKIDPPSESSAQYILLTGATGYFGRYVLKALLKSDSSCHVICYVRERYGTWGPAINRPTNRLQNFVNTLAQEQRHRVSVLVYIPTHFKYRSVIHLAANVNHALSFDQLEADNVDLTVSLLKMNLAPMIYCSSSSTRMSNVHLYPSAAAAIAASNGYTQTKFVSEQIVLQSSRMHECFWPPLLIWNNSRDWLTRLIDGCLKCRLVPDFNNSNIFGYAAVCPTDIAADDLVNGQPCSQWDLDLSTVFRKLYMSNLHRLRIVPTLDELIDTIRSKPTNPAYPVLPIILQTRRIGGSRTPSLEMLPDLYYEELDLSDSTSTSSSSSSSSSTSSESSSSSSSTGKPMHEAVSWSSVESVGSSDDELDRGQCLSR